MIVWQIPSLRSHTPTICGQLLTTHIDENEIVNLNKLAKKWSAFHHQVICQPKHQFEFGVHETDGFHLSELYRFDFVYVSNQPWTPAISMNFYVIIKWQLVWKIIISYVLLGFQKLIRLFNRWSHSVFEHVSVRSSVLCTVMHTEG